MVDHADQREAALLSDRDTTPELDPSVAEHYRKRHYPRKQRKRNTVAPGRIPSPTRSYYQDRELTLQPIETSALRDGEATRVLERKSQALWMNGDGKLGALSFETTRSEEYLDGDITITSSYPSLKEQSVPEIALDQKSSLQKTQSTSQTLLSSASARTQETSLGGWQRAEDKVNAIDSGKAIRGERWMTEERSASPEGGGGGGGRSGRVEAKRRAYWWEAYNTRMVKPMSTCLLVSEAQSEDEQQWEPSPHNQIIDHFIATYRTSSFSSTKGNHTSLKDQQIDLEFLAKCLDSGVDVDQTDDAGQTVLMEAVRSWHLDVIAYLIDNEAKVTHQDAFGRAPIHVASSANRPAVIHLLIAEGAFINLKIRHSEETPLHLAARKGALLSIVELLELGADLEAKDYRGRTPLHSAAEFAKSDAVDLLLRNGSSATSVNNGGCSCLTQIVMTCPASVLVRALDSMVHRSDQSEKLLFNPAIFEACSEEWKEKVGTNCLLDVIESHECAAAIKHIVIQTLIKTRWRMFGRLWAIVNFFLRFLFFAVWTSWILAITWEKKYKYDWQHHWWRAVLPTLGIFFLCWEIKIEVLEARYSILRGVTLANIQLMSVREDLKRITHPCWKDEQRILQDKLKRTKKLTHWWCQMGLYARDFWNIYDFLIFTVILACMITHIIDIRNHDLSKARMHGQLGSITILLLGIRLMKDTRGFFGPGQLVIMLGLMASDFSRFIFLYLQLYLPFTISFWIVFGGIRHPYQEELCQFNCSALPDCLRNCTPSSFVTNVCDLNLPNCVSNRTNVVVSGMENYPNLCFSLFRLTLVDEYDMNAMRSIDPVMSVVLVGAFLLTSAVVGINFLIGLISNVIGDGARENVEIKSLLQKLRVILLIEQTPYICGPRPDQLCDSLSMRHHELDMIKDFQQGDDISIGEGLSEVNQGMAKLNKRMADIFQQHDTLLGHLHQLQADVQQLAQNTQRQNGGHGIDAVDSHGKHVPILPNYISARTTGRTVKYSSDMDSFLNYTDLNRDADADSRWRQMGRQREPTNASVRQTVVNNLNKNHRTRSASPLKHVKVTD